MPDELLNRVPLHVCRLSTLLISRPLFRQLYVARVPHWTFAETSRQMTWRAGLNNMNWISTLTLARFITIVLRSSPRLQNSQCTVKTVYFLPFFASLGF